MFGAVGIPELVIVVVIVGAWLVPLAAAIWALLTLRRLQEGQQDIQARLDRIERQRHDHTGTNDAPSRSAT